MLFYLWKRNSTYYYRIKIPADLSDLFPIHHIRTSLKSKNLDAAKVSAAIINQRVQNNFALLRSGAVDLGTPDEIGKVFAGFQKYLYQQQATL